jgi:hypothetical protein
MWNVKVAGVITGRRIFGRKAFLSISTLRKVHSVLVPMKNFTFTREDDTLALANVYLTSYSSQSGQRADAVLFTLEDALR